MEETMGLLILQLNWGFKWGPRYGPRIRISRGVRKLAPTLGSPQKPT